MTYALMTEAMSREEAALFDRELVMPPPDVDPEAHRRAMAQDNTAAVESLAAMLSGATR